MRVALVLWVVAVITRYSVKGFPAGGGFAGYPPSYHNSFVPPLPQELTNFLPQEQRIPPGIQRPPSKDPIAHPTPVDSYAAPASGTDSLPPKTHTIKPLPPLLPSSVLKQLMQTLAATLPNGSGRLSSLPPIPKFESSKENEKKDSSNPGEGNVTLYAAGLLSSFLQPEDLSGQTIFREIDAGAISEQSLNKTNVIIIKSEKRAFVVPANTAAFTGAVEPATVQGLYENKDKLDSPYTLNQFLFIVKPRNVNFLNKLA